MGLEQIKVTLESFWGGDRNAAESAWASSFDKAKAEAKTDDDVRRVVAGLVTQHHDTPKERVWLDFFCTFPIFVERQFDKYRLTQQYQDFQVEFMYGDMGRNHITQNELSGRYRTIPERPYKMPSDIVGILQKAAHNMSVGAEIARDWNQRVEAQHMHYKWALDFLKDAEKGTAATGFITNAEYKRAREVLRGELGTAYLTDCRFVMNMNAFEHIVNQRIAPDAQLESNVVAYKMVNAVAAAKVCPAMLDTMIEENGWQEQCSRIAEYF